MPQGTIDNSINRLDGSSIEGVAADADVVGADARVDASVGVCADSTQLASRRLGYRFVKRAFDIVFSGVVIVVGFVPAVVLSAFVAKDTGGSPIYAQTRMGKDRKPFRIYKFRTMVADADDVEKYLTSEQIAEWNQERKVTDDPRITKLGSFLRRTSLDEVPQFLNVIAGQMSVVGPRPITDDELAHFGDNADKLLSRRPGITGWWQTQSRNDASFDTGERQSLELYYIDNASIGLDVRIAANTLKTMVNGTGV